MQTNTKAPNTARAAAPNTARKFSNKALAQALATQYIEKNKGHTAKLLKSSTPGMVAVGTFDRSGKYLGTLV
jgi:hypothetical protein